MSLLSDASLIITPNAVKEGKLYSIIPSNGNGDMTVVRLTGATRTNELGLIEPTPYNLLIYSEDFANANWNKSNVSVTLNQGIAPNNTNTVNKITVDNTSNVHFIRQSVTQTIGTKTLSFFVDKTQNRYVACSLIFGNNSNGGGIIVDTLTQTIVSSNFSGATFSVNYITIGNFLRISLTVTNTIDNIIDRAHISPYNNEPYTWQINAKLPSYTGDGISSLFVWGAQLVQGSVPKDYFYTTFRLNVPRINYDSVGGCPSILVEPQRTNLVTYSQNFSDVSWIKSADVTVTPNIQDVSNTNTAARISITNQYSAFYKSNLFTTSGGTAVISVWIKRVSGSTTIGFRGSTVGSIYFTTINITNEWKRYDIAYTHNGTNNIGIAFQKTTSNIDPDVFDICFAQLEAGAYPTSYIPTTTQAITRNADVISKTGISSLMNPSQGTFYVEAAALNNVDTTSRWFALGNAEPSLNTILIQFPSAGSQIRFDVNGGGSINRLILSGITITNFNKIAISWSSSGSFAYVNGVKYTMPIVSGTVNAVPTALSRIDFDAYYTGQESRSKIKSAIIFKTQLTDQECIALTTL